MQNIDGQITARIPHDMILRVDKIARQEHSSRSRIIRLALLSYIQEVDNETKKSNRNGANHEQR